MRTPSSMCVAATYGVTQRKMDIPNQQVVHD
jgi:hypothetical protein